MRLRHKSCFCFPAMLGCPPLEAGSRQDGRTEQKLVHDGEHGEISRRSPVQQTLQNAGVPR